MVAWVLFVLGLCEDLGVKRGFCQGEDALEDAFGWGLLVGLGGDGGRFRVRGGAVGGGRVGPPTPRGGTRPTAAERRGGLNDVGQDVEGKPAGVPALPGRGRPCVHMAHTRMRRVVRGRRLWAPERPAGAGRGRPSGASLPGGGGRSRWQRFMGRRGDERRGVFAHWGSTVFGFIHPS